MKQPVLQIGIPAQKDLLGKNLRNIRRHIGIIVAPAAVFRELFKEPRVRIASHRHRGQRNPCVCIFSDNISIVSALPLPVRQKDHMADARLAVPHTLKRRPQRRLNGRSAALRYGLDLCLDLLFLIGSRRLHHPLKSVIEGDNAHLVRIPHLIHSRLCGGDCQIQACRAARLHTHASRVIDDHDHRRGRYLIHTPQLHIHRKHRLQNAVPIAAQGKTVLAADADEPTAVILHIGLQICQKSLRQIRQIHILEQDALILQQPFQGIRRTRSIRHIKITARAPQKILKRITVLPHAGY